MTTLDLKTQIIQEIDSDQDSAILKKPQVKMCAKVHALPIHIR